MMSFRGFVVALALTVAAATVWAQSNLRSVRVGGAVIVVGDSEAKVRSAGRPSNTVNTFNAQGAPVGQRYEFRSGNKTTHVEVAMGRVTGVWQVND